MRVAVITATGGRAYGDLRVEAALVKGALLYADDVRLVTGKLPALYIQTYQQMRRIGQLSELTEAYEASGHDPAAAMLEESRRRDPKIGDEVERMLGEAGTASAYLNALKAVWEEILIPAIGASSPDRHLAVLRRLLPDMVATYARRQETAELPLTTAARELTTAAAAGSLEFDLLDAGRAYGMDAEQAAREILERLFDAVIAMATNPGSMYPMFDDRSAEIARLLTDKSTQSPSAMKTADLAQELVVTMEAFPMASMDVILDVRERLKPSAVRFRAALADAAAELDELAPGAGFSAAVEDLRIRKIAPARQDIEENLEALNVRTTLLRGWPKAAIGTLGLAAAAALKAPELAQYVPLAAGASTAFTAELLKRRELAAARERNQFFFLHAAEHYLAEAIDDHARRA